MARSLNGKTTTKLVETGQFRWSRNPMYLFGTVWYAGLALVLGEPGPLMLLPVSVLVTHFGVVLREEQYLERTFGTAYDQYRMRVRRWL